MALSCIISEMKQDIGRKSWFFHTPLHLTPLFRGSSSEYCHHVWYGKTKWWGYLVVKNFDDMCNRLDTILACDRRTDRQTSCHGIDRAMYTRRAVKIVFVLNVNSPNHFRKFYLKFWIKWSSMRILCVSGCHIVMFLVSTCVFQTSCFRAVNCVIVISCDCRLDFQ